MDRQVKAAAWCILVVATALGYIVYIASEHLDEDFMVLSDFGVLIGAVLLIRLIIIRVIR